MGSNGESWDHGRATKQSDSPYEKTVWTCAKYAMNVLIHEHALLYMHKIKHKHTQYIYTHKIHPLIPYITICVNLFRFNPGAPGAFVLQRFGTHQAAPGGHGLGGFLIEHNLVNQPTVSIVIPSILNHNRIKHD